jgi:hypothetical protein
MNLLTLEEIKLMARIFASMIPETLIETKIHVLEEDPKVVLQMGGELAASQKIKPNLLQYFRCLAIILEKNEDS